VLYRNRTAVAVVGLLVGFSAPTRAAEPETIKVGLVQGMFRDVKPIMIKALSVPFKDILTKQTGLDATVDVNADAHVLAERMKDQTLNVGVFHGFEFAWVRQSHPELIPLVVSVPHGRKVTACVVVHKDCPFEKVSELKDECLVLPKGAKAHCFLYLDKVRAGLPATIAAAKPSKTQSAEEVLDEIVSGDSPACVVDAAQLAGYQTLKPGAFKHLKVMCESEAFPPAVIAYRKGSLSEQAVEKLRTGLINANATAAGKPLMMLWNVKGFEGPPSEYEALLAACAKAYPVPKAAPVSPDGK
jgi:ABC-type phosphate/phosphonate transport system substrate-binding protein